MYVCQRYIYLFVLAQFLVVAEVLGQFADDFSDGNFTSNPTWHGDTSNFQVNGSSELQLVAPAVTAVSQLHTSSQAIGNSSFDFFVRLDFDPSASNLAKIFVVSTDSNLSNGNGYFVQVGGATGTVDDVSLYYQNGATSTKIIDGMDGTVAVSPSLHVRVTRDMLGSWELLIDTGLTGNFVSQGTVVHNQTTHSDFFGIQCIYTSTRSDKFFFDDFVVSGGLVVDITPPTVDSVSMLTPTLMEVYFNEPVDAITAEQTSNYVVNSGIGNPIFAEKNQSQSHIVLLEFSAPLPNFTALELTVSQVEDVSGNVIIPQIIPFVTSYPVSYDFGSIIINEIFADPSPSQGMPEAEFIELYNASNIPIGLGSWTYGDPGTKATLTAYTLSAHDYIILCAMDDTGLFSGYGKVLGISPWPTLNNSDDQLGLRDSFGNLIDSVGYESSWYRDADKAQGGFSLERINPNDICGGAQNWTASTFLNGATPGMENSVLDTISTPFSLVSAYVSAIDVVELEFSKTVDTSFVSISTFEIQPLVGISNIQFSNGDFSRLQLVLDSPLERGLEYRLVANNMIDCEGVALVDSTTQVYLSEKQDILINEILFNPKTGGSDFVELYNNTENPIDLKNWSLMYYGTTGDSLFKLIQTTPYILYPTDFVVLTEDSTNVQWTYPGSGNSNFIEMDLPTFSNASGEVILIDQLQFEMDYLNYNEDMHIEIITDPKGVSLERTTYAKGENSANNWHSASSVAGYATPGYVNSQWINASSDGGNLTLDPTTFSPNNDGYKDAVAISYSLDQNDNIGTVSVHYTTGEIVRTLVNNQSMGAEGVLFWDGTDENGEILPTGMYIIMMRVLTLENDAQIFKKVVVLAQP